MENQYQDMSYESTLEAANPVEIKAPENVALGFMGALVGAVLGGASIVLLSQLGYVASLSGVLLAFCTLKGYQLLGKSMSKKGIVLCVLLMVVTPFLADWADWAIYLMKDYDIAFGDAFVFFGELLLGGFVEMDVYLKNLGMIYLFVALGALGTIKNAIGGK